MSDLTIDLEKYELTLVLDKYATMKRLTALKHNVQKHTMREIKREDWVVDDVKPLAYKLDGHTEVGYVYCDVWLDKAGVKELETDLANANNVIRYLLVKAKQNDSLSMLETIQSVVEKYSDDGDLKYSPQINGNGRPYDEIRYSLEGKKYVMMIGEDNE